MMENTMSSEPQPTFEALYHELEETIRRLEAGDLTLDESLALFEQGTLLAEQCNALLDSAEMRVRQLTTRSDGGVEAEPFEAWHNG
jgi:exodeoxyribonuclease VII small subunit